MDEITELEQMVEEEEIEAPPDDSALTFSKYAYNAAVIILDLITGWTIWQLSFWYYGVLWVLAGAVVFYLHQKNWERAGNNEKQTSLSMTGMIVAVVSMLLMSIVSGGLWIAKNYGAGVDGMWAEIGIVGSAIVLYAWHAFQIARYRFQDDKFKTDRLVARAKAQGHKKIQIIQAAGDVVAASRKALQERDRQYRKHGDRGAVDRAVAKVEGRDKRGDGKKGDQSAPSAQPVMASDMEQVIPPDPQKASPNGKK